MHFIIILIFLRICLKNRGLLKNRFLCVAHTSRVADDSCYKLWQVILLRVLKKKRLTKQQGIKNVAN